MKTRQFLRTSHVKPRINIIKKSKIQTKLLEENKNRTPNMHLKCKFIYSNKSHRNATPKTI